MAYLCNDVSDFISSALATGYDLDSAIDLYQKVKIIELNHFEISRAVCHTYADWLDSLFEFADRPIIESIDEDLPERTEFSDSTSGIASACAASAAKVAQQFGEHDVCFDDVYGLADIDVPAFPCIPKGAANFDLKNIVADALYGSQIFPLTKVKLDVLRGGDLDKLSLLFDVVNTVSHSTGIEQQGFGIESLTGPIKSRVKGAVGYVFKTANMVTSLASASELLERIFQRVLNAFDYISSSVGVFSSFMTGLKDKVLEKCSQLWEKLAEWGDHFYYIIPTFCSVFLVSITCFLVNKFLALVAPTYCFSMSTVVQLIVVCCAIVGADRKSVV